MLQLTNHSPDAPLEMLAVDEFFAIATKEEDWHDEEERETVQRFQNLVLQQLFDRFPCSFTSGILHPLGVDESLLAVSTAPASSDLGSHP